MVREQGKGGPHAREDGGRPVLVIGQMDSNVDMLTAGACTRHTSSPTDDAGHSFTWYYK